jgi:hypothetical protein
LEGLEDRKVLSTVFHEATFAVQEGNSLFINVAAGQNLELSELNPTGNRQIELFDNGQVFAQFSINSIQNVGISVHGNDQVIIDDSDGMPFATGSNISFTGSGTDNSITLQGLRSIDTGEVYTVGATASTSPTSSIGLDGLKFQMNSAIDSVTDFLEKTGGPLVVNASSSQNVSLTSLGNGLQRLSDLGPGGGGTFTFANMPSLQLNESAADVTVNVDTPQAASEEQRISINTSGLGDTVVIAADGVGTAVHTAGSDSEVVLQAITAPVSVTGDSSTTPTTTLFIGQPQGNSGDVTSGIQANVVANGINTLIVDDSGNVSTKENVKVTESTVSGTGLFGNNAATLSYGNVTTLDIESGQLADTYTVEASSSTAQFHTRINLLDDSNQLFNAKVDLDAHSGLTLGLDKLSKQGKADLFIDAPHGKFHNSKGVITVSFHGGLTSTIHNNGFKVKEERS